MSNQINDSNFVEENGMDKVFQLVLEIFNCFTKKRRIQYKWIIVLIVISSAAEIISLGSVIPFLTAMTNPEAVFKISQINIIVKLLDISDNRQLIFWVAMAFGCSAIVSGLLRYILLQTITRTSFSAGAELGTKIFRNLAYSNYTYHVSTNSSDHIDVVTNKVNNIIFNVVMPALMLISSALIIASITIFLIVLNPIAAGASIGFFVAIYSIILLSVRKNLSADASIIARKSSNLVKQIQENLAGIRDVIIDNCQEKVIERFSITNNSLREAQGNNQIRSQSPRYLVETLGVVFIAAITYYLTVNNGELNSVVPIIGALALSSQKMLPLAQNAFNAYANIQGSKASIIEVLNMAKLNHYFEPKPGGNHLSSFKKNILLENVSFSYGSDSKKIINGINLEISKGDKIGIVGDTGSGKSTLIDILLGLLEPTQGDVKVDGHQLNRDNITEWQKLISHVPQRIFLADASLAENIAYGLNANEIDFKRLYQAIKLSVLEEYINTLELGIRAQVGERGVQLSGGQCQRIGIARAIYKEADVMILDEATSSLDNNTEEKVINSIMHSGKNITIIAIAHRIMTLRFCNKIYMLKNGELIFIGDFDDLLEYDNAEKKGI